MDMYSTYCQCAKKAGYTNPGKGYLRAGKILQLMGKPEVALAIYERGLGSIPLNHPAREVRSPGL